jgi:putative membrane protein
MTHTISRAVLSFATAALCACGADQKAPTTSANANETSMPSEAASPQPGEAAMRAPDPDMTGTPPAAPSDRTSNEARSGNAVAAPRTADAPPALPPLSQNQIALVTQLANDAEIEQGKLAQSKAKSKDVKKFAAMMVKHHGQAKTEQTKLYQQLGLSPAQSPDATSLKESADKLLGSLRGAEGAAFDRAYIDSQVEAHQKVLDTIERQLLPAASDADLISNLKQMRETVQSHLKDALDLQAELAKDRAH